MFYQIKQKQPSDSFIPVLSFNILLHDRKSNYNSAVELLYLKIHLRRLFMFVISHL